MKETRSTTSSSPIRDDRERSKASSRSTTRGESIRVMYPLFQVGEGGSIPTSPLQMRVIPIEFSLARDLVECWHSTLPRFNTGFIKNQPYPCFGAVKDDRLYAVAIWSHPVARSLPQQTWLELRRFAIAPDAPRYTASWMLGLMRRLLAKKLPEIERHISYQDLGQHTGTIYKAAGWKPTTMSANGKQWCCRSRPRPQAQSSNAKQRWEIAA